MLEKEYDPQDIEQKWYDFWLEKNLFHAREEPVDLRDSAVIDDMGARSAQPEDMSEGKFRAERVAIETDMGYKKRLPGGLDTGDDFQGNIRNRLRGIAVAAQKWSSVDCDSS